MNKLAIALIAIAVVGLGFFIASKPSSNNNSNNNQSGMTFSTVQSDITKDAKLYDVRTPEEFASGHFAGAMNMPLQDLQAGALPQVAKDTKIYVYCQSGNRSGQATTLLKQAGYTNVTDLGGVSKVQSIGGTLTK